MGRISEATHHIVVASDSAAIIGRKSGTDCASPDERVISGYYEITL